MLVGWAVSAAVSAPRVAPVVGLTMLLAVLFRPTAPAHAQTQIATAQRTYLADCAVCHGERATGTKQGPSLVGVGPASIDYVLSTGRMPLDPIKDERTSRRR